MRIMYQTIIIVTKCQNLQLHYVELLHYIELLHYVKLLN